MKKDMVALLETFAMEIFSRRFVELDAAQQAFVDYHVYAYNYYKKNLSKVLREALQKGKLHKEYDTILSLYLKRLPPDYFQAAIEKGKEEARKQGCTTYAIGWFEDRFEDFLKKYKNDVVEYIEGRIDVDVDYPWLFNIYRFILEKDTPYIFDSWWGFRKRKQNIVSVEKMLRETDKGIKVIEDQMREIKVQLKESNLDKNTKNKFKNRLKWVKKKLKKHKEKFEYLKNKLGEVKDDE